MSQFLNNVPRTKGWGSFEAKVTEWIKAQQIKLENPPKESDHTGPAENREDRHEAEVELNHLSFSNDSVTTSEASMDGVAVHSPNHLFMVPYSNMEPNFQMWIPYSNPFPITPQVGDALNIYIYIISVI